MPTRGFPPAVDRTALRIERIRQNLDGKRFAIDLLARIHIAVLAVFFTVVASIALAGLTRQLDASLAFPGVVAAGTAVALQLRALRELTREWNADRERAARATDILIASRGEDEHDD